jgi:ribosomal protein S18 acetylase RimI-like enzyme
VATYRGNPEISFSVNTRKEHNPAFGKYPAEDLLVVRVEAFDGAARVAWLEAYQRSSRWSADSDSLEVTNVVVEPDYRRKKIATEMYRLAEDATGMRILSSKKQSDAGKALWASFRKAHLRNNPRANPEGIDGEALAAWCDSNESYAVLDETASAGSSWMAGACVLLAKALVARHPEAQLVGLEVDGDVQHVGALVGDVVYDALGAHRERAWARDWLAYEQLHPRTPARLVSLPPGVPASVLPDAEAPATARDVRLVARALPA